jgi:hypothetical protein
MYPRAKTENVLIQQFEGELVVYDKERQQAHNLNRTAALVWQHCDGETSIADLTALLQTEMGTRVSQETVWFALEQLQRAHLIQDIETTSLPHITRRDLVKKLAIAGGAAVLLPVVKSITAPTPAMAQTGPLQAQHQAPRV